MNLIARQLARHKRIRLVDCTLIYSLLPSAKKQLILL